MTNFRQRINDFIKLTEDKKHNVDETLAIGNKLLAEITEAWRSVHTNRDQLVYEKLGKDLGRYIDNYKYLSKKHKKENPRTSIKKIVIQNISSLPIQKETIEGTGRIHVSSPQNFQPINRLITNGILYLYYDRKFRLIKEGKDSIRIVPSGK